MIPSTTVTGFGSTGSGVQTITGPTASSSGSVTRHDVPPQLPRIESFSGQSLQQRSVSASLLFASLGNLASDASLKNLALDDRERVMKMIQKAQQELDVCSDAITPILNMHREASNMGIIATNEVPLGRLNPGLPTLKFTAWPRTLNPDLIIPSISSLHYLQEAIREICRQANIAVHNEAGLQDQKDAIISNILTSKKEIESLKNKIDELKNELARLVHESTEDSGRIQSLEKELEDTNHKLTLSQENARGAAEELQNLKSTLERKNIELNTLKRKASEAKNSIQELKKQNASTKCQLKLSQNAEDTAKAKIRKLDETYKKSSDVIQSLSNELKIMTENEHAKQKKLIGSLQKMVNLHEQLNNETDDLKSKLLASEEKFQKFKADIASDIGCSEAINPVDLVEQVSALGKKLYSSEVECSSLLAEYHVIKDSERNLYAENLKKEEELKNLRHLLKDAEETLRRNQQSLKDRGSAVNVDHGYAKRQEPCTKIPQSVTTNEIDREAVDTLLLLSGQSPSDATPELRSLLQKKETAG